MLPYCPSTRLSIRSILPSQASGALPDFKAPTQPAAPTPVTTSLTAETAFGSSGVAFLSYSELPLRGTLLCLCWLRATHTNPTQL